MDTFHVKKLLESPDNKSVNIGKLKSRRFISNNPIIIKNDGGIQMLIYCSDGKGSISFWCFPIDELEKLSKQTEKNKNKNLIEQNNLPLKYSSSFINPNKKQISCFCY